MSILHPKLLTTLARFFPSSCAIQANTPTRDTDGAPLESWATVAGLGAIPCAVSAYRPNHEIRREADVVTLATDRIMLAGHYPSIASAMRAVIAGTNYDILWVEHDSQGTMTSLVARILLPTG